MFYLYFQYMLIYTFKQTCCQSFISCHPGIRFRSPQAQWRTGDLHPGFRPTGRGDFCAGP